MIGALTTVFQFTYALTLFCVGIYGVFYAEWEMAHFYGIAQPALREPEGATFIGQIRFLKAAECGLGLFGLLLRREIVAGGVESLIFTAALGLAIAARLIGWVADGRPEAMFLWFLAFEAVTFLLLVVHTSRAPDQA
jgi:hypothetical protein